MEREEGGGDSTDEAVIQERIRTDVDEYNILLPLRPTEGVVGGGGWLRD